MKLVFVFLLIAFTMLSIGEASWMLSIYDSKKTLEEQILSSSQNVNSMMIDRIDNYISERLIDMVNLATNQQIEDTLSASNTKFQQMEDPRTYIEQQNVTWMSVPRDTITPIMSEIIENPASDTLREQLSQEKSIFKQDVFGRLLIANSYGADVAASVKPDDYDQFTDTWWVGARQNGVYVGNITFDKASNSIGIPIAVRINDNNGNFIGVVKGVVDVDNIFKIIESQMESASIYPKEAMLLDKHGTVLYSTNSLHKSFTYTFPSEFVKKIQGTSGHFMEYEDDKNAIDLISYAGSVSSNVSPASNWIFVTEYDAESMLKPITNAGYTMVEILLLLIPSTIFIIAFIAIRLDKPMQRLSYATNEFKKGNKIKVESAGTDETVNLINNFNQMVELLNKSRNTILESEKKYRVLFESSPVAILLTNEKLDITQVNNRFLQLFGYEMNDIIGKPLTTILTNKAIQESEKINSSFGNNINFYDMLFWHKKKDGTEFPALVSVKSIFDEKNEFVTHIAMIKDITELENVKQKIIREEEYLAKSEAKYRALFELAPLSILLHDENFNIASVNDYFSNAFGYVANEIIGKPISTIIGDRSLKDFINMHNNVTNEKLINNVTLWYKKKDGTEFPALVSVKSIFDEKNKHHIHFMLIEDISEFEVASELVKKNEKEVKIQLEKIKEIDKLKSEFSSMVSHELSTPLFPIKFNAELLKDPKIFGQLNKEQIHAVDEIFDNATKLEKLINDVLDSQKIEMNTMKFLEKNIGISEFMEKILYNKQFLMKEKEITFVNSTTDKGYLTSDPDRLEQVFSNLIANSIDFVSEKTGRIEIGAKIQEKEVLFYVKDNGIGIPKEKQKDLFKKFYQIDTSLTRKHRGSGLGLSICKGIVDGLGGKIWLESIVNVGTIVSFTIPKGENIK